MAVAMLAAVLLMAIGAVTPVTAPAVAPAPVAEADRLIESGDGSTATLRKAVELYDAAGKAEPKDAAIQIKLAAACLDLGLAAGADGLAWYRRGEEAARRAVSLDARNADGHFLIAANRGRAARLLPMWKVSPTIVGQLEKDVLRALAIDPRHARALHMEGMLLYKTPAPLRALLEGKKSDVERYLTAAVKADPNYAPVRLDLAEFYLAEGRPADARLQAQAVVDMKAERSRNWRERYRPAAEALLRRSAA